MVCPNCGMENQEDLAVCAQCGQELPLVKDDQGKDFAWASLMLGIWSMLFYPYIFATAAFLAAALARRSNYRGKMGLLGVIFGLVALVGWAVFRFIL